MKAVALVNEKSSPKRSIGIQCLISNWWIGLIKSSAATFEPLTSRARRRRSLPLRPRWVLAGPPGTWPRDKSRGTQDIQNPGAEPEQQKHDQPPGGGSRNSVDPPAKARTDDNSGDEFAGKLQCLPKPGGTLRIRAFAPRPPVRTSLGKPCFETTPAALKVVVAEIRLACLSGPGFAGFVWPVSCGHRNLLPGQPQPAVRFKVARNIVSRPVPVKPRQQRHRIY